MSLKGKVAIVTGSTSGIGLGIARALAKQGCAIALNSFVADQQSTDLVKQLAQETGAKITFVKADMSKPTEIYTMVDQTTKDLGPVDIMVNNAGIQHVQPIVEFPTEKWDAVISTNLSAAFHATKAVLPKMIERKWGRIINIASAHGLIASAYKAAYVAAKHGMVGLTKVTALEVAELPITCNAICPGYVWTPLVEKQIPEQAKAYNMTNEDVIRNVLLASQPNKRFSTVEELGALAVFLCSEGAATITGIALPMDGGWTAH